MKSTDNMAFWRILISIFVISVISLFGQFHAHAAGFDAVLIKANPVQNAVPTITSISPIACHAGDPGFTLTVNGTNFMDGSTVKWNWDVHVTQYISPTQLRATIPASYLVAPGQASITVVNPEPGGGTSNAILFTILKINKLFMPVSLRSWPPQANIPLLEPINNADQDNKYTISWANPSSGATYILEEAWNPEFTNAGTVYQGPNLTWAVPSEGKLPRTYYYRVKAKNPYNESGWSATQSVTIYPLFVGLKVRWDGKGFIRTEDYFEVGTHEEIQFDLLTDPETIRGVSKFWYDPNPQGWEPENWITYYSVATGVWKGSDYISDPSWKWGYSWKLAYDSYFTNGSTIKIGGQKFTVTGPHSGYTIYGKAIQYWEFVNQDKFLYHDSGSNWTQYVHPGDVILRYDAGGSGLIIYDSVLRHYYYQGDISTYTVQYISTLSAATSLPGSPPVPMFFPITLNPLDQLVVPDDKDGLGDTIKLVLPRE